ncbi:MAG: PH domain-containing protein, partial [Actinomycetota bacterium]
MAFPRRLLIEGEELVLDLRPHWIALVGPAAVTVLVVVGWILAIMNAPEDGTGRSVVIWGSLGVGVAILLWYPLRAFVAWATSNFALTSDRVIHREGFIAKRTMEIPLEAINDVRFHQSVFERIVGAGDLIIQSASEFGRNVF